MSDYLPLVNAAVNLHTTPETLNDFTRAGWIHVTVKDGSPFLSKREEYSARFILHLRQKLDLTNEQIGIVLADEQPPYSLEKVPGILARHAASTAD